MTLVGIYTCIFIYHENSLGLIFLRGSSYDEPCKRAAIAFSGEARFVDGFVDLLPLSWKRDRSTPPASLIWETDV